MDDQLILATVGPVPFGLVTDDDWETRTAPKELYQEDDMVRPFKCYIHGVLDRMCGFDIPHLVRGQWPSEAGEYPCYVFDNPEHFVDALLIVWRAWRPDDWRPSRTPLVGLICAATDHKSIEYARARALSKRYEL